MLQAPLPSGFRSSTIDSLSNRAVITLAVGKPLYIRLAVNLARSFLISRSSEIPFHIVTDRVDLIPKDLSSLPLVKLQPRELGEGFSPKLHLDRLAPADHTLFIDADCLCVRDVTFVFERFEGRPVGVIGGTISSGEWFGDVESLCRKFGVRSLPKFNGGVYYLERGDVSSSVYRQARELERHYDEIGLKRLRNRPNDELLIAIAMAQHGLAALADDGSFLNSPFECPGRMEVDVISGHSLLVNPLPPDPLHRSWYSLHEVHPAIIHFLGEFHVDWRYRREALRLAFAARGNTAKVLGIAVSKLYIEWPARILAALKAAIRPFYHRFFGFRAVRRSDRI